MTGPYEEPTPRHEANWQPPAGQQGAHARNSAGGDQSGAHGVAQHEAEQSGQHAAPEPHPVPSYVEPTGSGGFPLPGNQSGPHPVVDGSGPFPPPGSTSGPYPAPASQSGPHPMPGHHSGPYPTGFPQHQMPFPFEQQFPPGGPAQPPMPQPGQALPGQPLP
ncbi:MAG TPA: hypothetical protein VJX10_01520, partial [Pseudonocardiaceae bacterium]|nr:hypothetical protein [Pseudonocardiaceae bacterium]